MSRNRRSRAGALILALAAAGTAPAQTTTTTTQTTTTQATTTQGQVGTSTIIEYPTGKEVTVELAPGGSLSGARGTATVMRSGDTTTLRLNLTGLPQDATSYNVYAVDPSGAVTLLGPVAVSGGAAAQTFTTPLGKFMFFLSPEANLSTYSPGPSVVFSSTVPAGMAVVPFAESRPKTSAVHASATTTASATPAYSVPMLGVSRFKLNAWNRLRVNFSGALAGSEAELLVRPRSDQAAEVHANFHRLQRTGLPPGTRVVLWSVSPDNTFTRLGQVVDTGARNKADIHSEVNLKDFGLFITTEGANEAPQPSGPVVGTITVGAP